MYFNDVNSLSIYLKSVIDILMLLILSGKFKTYKHLTYMNVYILDNVFTLRYKFDSYKNVYYVNVVPPSFITIFQ